MSDSMTKHRSKSRIYADILRAVDGGGVKVTEILHQANVPYERLASYMEHMERAGLIDRMPDGEGAKVSLTAKGKRYLVEFKRLEEFSRTFGVEI